MGTYTNNLILNEKKKLFHDLFQNFHRQQHYIFMYLYKE